MENNSEYKNSFTVLDISQIIKNNKKIQTENDPQAICTTHSHNVYILDSFQWLLNLLLLFCSLFWKYAPQKVLDKDF